MRILGLIPPIAVLAIFSWGIFSYVNYLWIADIPILLKLAMALAFFSMVFLSLGSYFVCFLKKHPNLSNEFTIPSEMDLNDNVLEKDRCAVLERLIETRKLPILGRSSFSNFVKYCRQCQIIKPDRAHHCSQCNKCILKMDHHCIWVGNCVGYANYKSFVLFLFYTTLLAVFTSATTLPFVLDTWRTSNNMNFTMLALMPGIISLSTAILFIFHLYLLGRNQTTIETYQVPAFVSNEFSRNKYSLGFTENFLEVFGDDPSSWLWPWGDSRGNGVIFPIRVHGQIHRNPSTLLLPRSASTLERIQDGNIFTDGSQII